MNPEWVRYAGQLAFTALCAAFVLVLFTAVYLL
jgi:hypothetical protein